MALVSRARIAGIFAICLLMLSSLGATRATAGAARPQIDATQTATIVIGNNSCVGTDACTGAVGPIGDNSCNSDNACRDTTGSIGNNSCNGAPIPCRYSSADIGDNACQGSFACTVGSFAAISRQIGDNSCIGTSACESASGSIGHDSCNGGLACLGAAGDIGDYSCNGTVVCDLTHENIGDCQLNTVTPPECLPNPDAQIRLGSGSFVGDNTYNTDGVGQKVFNTGVVEQKLTFFIKIQNDSALSDSFKVKRSSGFTNGYRVRYYDAANNDVTGKVNAGTFTTPNLLPFNPNEYVMRATVKIKSWATPCSFTSRLITISSVADPTAKDAVRFTAALATPGLNCPPVAVDDNASITEDAVPDYVTGNVLANDIDPDGDTLLVSNAPVVAATQWGVLLLYADGSYTYTAAFLALHYGCLLDSGESVSLPTEYFVSDGQGGTDTAFITITINGISDPETCPL